MKNMLVTMDRLGTGDRAVIYSLNNVGDMRRRLLEIGFVKGAEVLCLGRAPLYDPIAYGIKGSVIALRASDASNITVSTEEH